MLPGVKRQSLSGQLATTIPSNVIFSRSGNVGAAYLEIGTVLSNATGFPIRINDSKLAFASVQNETTGTFTVNIIEWNGTSETIKATISVTSALGADFTPVGDISLTYGNSLRCRVSSGSAKNPVVLVYLVGEVPL